MTPRTVAALASTALLAAAALIPLRATPPPPIDGGPIERPVTLRGHGLATLAGDGTTHVVAVRAAGVTIEGFVIRGSGLDLGQDQAGIHVTGAHVTIRDNHIVESLHGVYVRQADGARIEGNTIVGRAETTEIADPLQKGLKPGEGELCVVAPARSTLSQ